MNLVTNAFERGDSPLDFAIGDQDIVGIERRDSKDADSRLGKGNSD
jgi:hypothetical protein